MHQENYVLCMVFHLKCIPREKTTHASTTTVLILSNSILSVAIYCRTNSFYLLHFEFHDNFETFVTTVLAEHTRLYVNLHAYGAQLPVGHKMVMHSWLNLKYEDVYHIICSRKSKNPYNMS